jgi:hypothetical protein
MIGAPPVGQAMAAVAESFQDHCCVAGFKLAMCDAQTAGVLCRSTPVLLYPMSAGDLRSSLSSRFIYFLMSN